MKEENIEETNFTSEVENIALAIEKIAAAMEVFNKGRLRHTAVVTLLCHETKVSKRDVEKILRALKDFGRLHLQNAVRKNGYGLLEPLMEPTANTAPQQDSKGSQAI